MPRIFGAVVVSGALLVALVPGAEAKRVGCHPSKSKTIVTSKQTRVFRYKGLVWGCLLRRGVAVRMTTDDGYGRDFLRNPKPVLAGRYVAFTFYWEGSVEGYGNAVEVIDLKTGRQNLSDFDATESREAESAVVKKIVLSPTGWVAWSWIVDYDKRKAVTEIRKLAPGRSDVGSESKPLDEGPDIDPLSLQRQGNQIVWLHAYGQRTSKFG